MKTKLNVIPNNIAIRIDENSFFSTVLGFTPGWDYKCDERYTIQKVVNSSSTNKIHLKADIIGGSVVNGIREPIF